MRLGRKVTSTAGIACAVCVCIYILYVCVSPSRGHCDDDGNGSSAFWGGGARGAERGENLLCGGSGINR